MSLLLHGKLKKRLFSKKYIYGMNEENMAKKRNSHIILNKRVIMGGSGTLT